MTQIGVSEVGEVTNTYAGGELSVGFDVTTTKIDDGVELAGLLDFVLVLLFTFFISGTGTGGSSGLSCGRGSSRGNAGSSYRCYGSGGRSSFHGFPLGKGKSRNGQDLEGQDEASLELHFE